MANDVASSSAAPFAQRKSTRTLMRRLRFVQRVLGVVFITLTAAAWLHLINVHSMPEAAVVPLLVLATAPAVFARKPWLSLLPRISLWASLFCGSSVALLASHVPSRENLAVLAVVAAAGLVSLGRFARSIGTVRPLLAALIAIAIADASTTGLLGAFTFVEGHGHADRNAMLVLACASTANAVGVFFILKFRRYLPHIIGNVLVIAIAAADLGDMSPVNWLIAGPAFLQVLLALAQRLPRVSSRTRRNAELAMRIGLVALAIATTSTLWWR